MRLLYITNSINGSGGLERVLSIKASYLADFYGYDITILTLNDGDLNLFYNFSRNIKTVSIGVFGNPAMYLLRYKNGVQRQVDRILPDVICVCDDGLKGFFLPSIIRFKGKWIYERHASIKLNTTNSLKGRLTAFLMRTQVKKFSKFVVLSDSNIHEWNKPNVFAISNPLSFSMAKQSSLENRKLISVGSHSLNKGYDTLLIIWKELMSTFSDWELHIYGKKDSNKTFIKLSKSLGLQNIFFHDPVRNIEQKYLESSIMLLPSRSEGFGMVLIEAMECGLPCISFDCPSGPRDIIKNNIDGLLIENQNVSSFKKAIESLILSMELRKELGRQAKINVKRYSVDAILLEWDKLFKSL